MSKWELYIEGSYNDPAPEYIKLFDNIKEAKYAIIESVQCEYEARISLGYTNNTNPKNMITIQNNNPENGWDIDQNVFYEIPEETTNRKLILLATYEKFTEYLKLKKEDN